MSKLLATLPAIALAAVLIAPAHAVADGIAATPGQFPFAVKITLPKIPASGGGTYASACSGAIIAAQWVITAGHCFHDLQRNPVSGLPYPATVSNDSGTLGGVTEVVQSPYNDVAVIKLDKPTTVKPTRISVSLPQKDDQLILAGWGVTANTDTQSTGLHYGFVDVTTVNDYTVLVKGAAPKPTISACKNDSGAPYFTQDGAGTTTLVSIENNGPDCPHAGKETTARVDAISGWIDRTIHSKSIVFSAP